jgi:hemerythrin-like domain-containing protein
MNPHNLSPADFAEWMQSEHRLLRQLGKLLREHIVAMPDSNRSEWIRGLRAAFDRLAKHLEQNFTAQEAAGYLNPVLERRPTLWHEVEELRAEHPQLLHMAHRIQQELADVQPAQAVLLADITARVQRFIAVIDQHDQRENMITLVATSLDIGAGD